MHIFVYLCLRAYFLAYLRTCLFIDTSFMFQYVLYHGVGYSCYCRHSSLFHISYGVARRATTTAAAARAATGRC